MAITDSFARRKFIVAFGIDRISQQQIASLLTILEQDLVIVKLETWLAEASAKLSVTIVFHLLTIGCAASGVQTSIVLIAAIVKDLVFVLNEPFADAAVRAVQMKFDKIVVYVHFAHAGCLAKVLIVVASTLENVYDRIYHIVSDWVYDVIYNRINDVVIYRIDYIVVYPISNRA